MPSIAPIWKTWSYAAATAGVSLASMSPHELETMSASRLSTILFRESSSASSLQDAAPTYRMSALGATACTASTSRVSSPYQPAAPHSSTSV